jgi:hypothetical protein
MHLRSVSRFVPLEDKVLTAFNRGVSKRSRIVAKTPFPVIRNGNILQVGFSGSGNIGVIN